ncbi:hypothetical protein [Bradyrhizobium sp. STM 3809]|uniref:hypothetical protein n=1 Tax=Bradyrhizobium sp. STM 3809 TaxID=551936 RepID=UPI0002409D57|nr:hypothetical protein [Bradyrhizobium sp. STM 3809]CCE01814.1 conserved exported hypothetical protein [Bradyrhizobium sp. STM 3809]
MRIPASGRRRVALSLSLLPAGLLIAGAAEAREAPPVAETRPPFTATLSNVSPLAFGMDVGETSRVLAQPLIYLNGTPGNETFLALRNLGGSGLVPHHHRLFLKFRKGRLTGWKEDYGTNWMWR